MQQFSLPTEPIGSIPRPKKLIEAILSGIPQVEINRFMDEAVLDTIKHFEKTGSPVITDGEQRKSSFVTYPIHGATNLSSNGIVIPFKDGHTRQLPILNKGPFRYNNFAVADLKKAQSMGRRIFKQAVISVSALSLLYPQNGIPGYSREEFIKDLIKEAQKDIRQCLDLGAKVQIDFTEGRLAVKLDPSKSLLKAFIDLNNQVLSGFNSEEQKNIGVHTCPGGDHDSTHSADVDYTNFLPELFQLNVGNFYVQLASEQDRIKALKTIKTSMKPKQRIFIGVTDPISKQVETPEMVRDRIREALNFLPLENLGTTDDCGFSPFCDDVSTSRELAFAKIKARVDGTKLFLGL